MATRNRKKQRRPRQQRGGIRPAHILIVTIAAVLAVALLVILNINRSPQVAVADLTYETGVTPDGEPYKGSPDAPLRLIEYSDFLCGHCGNFADTLSALSPEYIETGKLQVVFRNYAFLAKESIQAAQAAECALDQGTDKFWQYHDLLFANRGTGQAAYSKPRLKAYASQLGLDTAAFNECLDSGAKAEEVQADRTEAENQGVQSTPTWFINDQIVRGAIPESDIRQIFESLLSQGS